MFEKHRMPNLEVGLLIVLIVIGIVGFGFYSSDSVTGYAVNEISGAAVSLGAVDKSELNRLIINYRGSVPSGELSERISKESSGNQFAISSYGVGLGGFVGDTAEEFENINDEWLGHLRTAQRGAGGRTWVESRQEQVLTTAIQSYLSDNPQADRNVNNYETWLPELDWRFDKHKSVEYSAKYLQEQFNTFRT